jgi:SHS2 domain-containing protein
MMEEPKRWGPSARAEAYGELDHPADVFLEVWGSDLPTLFENALFALYDQFAELEGFETERKEIITVRAPNNSEALRSLLSEALYRFETEGFVAVRAKIEVDTTAGDVQVTAHLDGETLDRHRHTLLTEVKAVTYHQLAVDVVPEGGWRATLLLDV